ncbi:MAG: prepilin-type N-terminal cleavage/methylation domain-containing protein [Ruminococcus sp.]|nr:prepilin-type N-terminal cleavage/methylation domain-containing protein [Ruminococcus sp.]
MKKKKALKGMTLVEVLVAIAILGIMTLFLAKNAYVIEDYNRATTRLNQKVAVEGPLAEMQKASVIQDVDEDGNLVYDISGNPVYSDHKIDDDVTIHVGYNTADLSKYAEVKGKAYTVEDAYTGDTAGVAGNELGLKFISLD